MIDKQKQETEDEDGDDEKACARRNLCVRKLWVMCIAAWLPVLRVMCVAALAVLYVCDVRSYSALYVLRRMCCDVCAALADPMYCILGGAACVVLINVWVHLAGCYLWLKIFYISSAAFVFPALITNEWTTSVFCFFH